MSSSALSICGDDCSLPSLSTTLRRSVQNWAIDPWIREMHRKSVTKETAVFRDTDPRAWTPYVSYGQSSAVPSA